MLLLLLLLCVRACMCARARPHVRVCVRAHMHACVCMHACMHVCMHACMSACMCDSDLANMRQTVTSSAMAASALASVGYSRLAGQLRRTVEGAALRAVERLRTSMTSGTGPLPAGGGMSTSIIQPQVTHIPAYMPTSMETWRNAQMYHHAGHHHGCRGTAPSSSSSTTIIARRTAARRTTARRTAASSSATRTPVSCCSKLPASQETRGCPKEKANFQAGFLSGPYS